MTFGAWPVFHAADGDARGQRKRRTASWRRAPFDPETEALPETKQPEPSLSRIPGPPRAADGSKGAGPVTESRCEQLIKPLWAPYIMTESHALFPRAKASSTTSPGFRPVISGPGTF